MEDLQNSSTKNTDIEYDNNDENDENNDENNDEANSDIDEGDDINIKVNNSDYDSDSDTSDIEEYQSTKDISKKIEQENDNININDDENIIANDLLKGDISNDYNSNDDSDYNSSDDEDKYQNLETLRPTLNDKHANLQSVNYIEVEKLTRVIRDNNNVIIDENHTTLPILSKYEKTRIIGLRSKQINSGAPPFISVNEEIVDGYIIAEQELLEKKIPFIIKRPISSNKFEYWKLEDLEIV